MGARVDQQDVVVHSVYQRGGDRHVPACTRLGWPAGPAVGRALLATESVEGV